MRRKKSPEKKATEIPGNDRLKTIAKQMSRYMNQQYRDAISYTPNTEEIAKVTVNKWLEMPEAFSDAVELPGLPFGNITCIYGKPDTGKTTCLQDAIASCQRQGILPILILTEHKFDFNRLSKWMDADPEAMLVLHADNLEQGYSYLEKLLKDIKAGTLVVEDENDPENDLEIDVKDQDIFIFWDSIGNTLSETELEYEVEEWDKSMGKHAKAIKTLTKRVNLLLSRVRKHVGICLLNQSYQSMPKVGPSVETPYGGDGVPYSSVLVLRFRRIRDLKMDIKKKTNIIGLETKIQVMKNHITHKKTISTVYTTAKGMIPATDSALKEYKKIAR